MKPNLPQESSQKPLSNGPTVLHKRRFAENQPSKWNKIFEQTKPL